MNLTSTLTRMGMANTDELGRIEMAKQRVANQLAMEQEMAQGQAIGGLAGAVLGAGVGLYNKFDKGKDSADAMQGFQARKDYADRLTDAESKGGSADLERQGITLSPAYQKGLDRSAAWRQEAADATQYQPRQSTITPLIDTRPEVTAPTGVDKEGNSLARPEGMVAGRVANEVPNTPTRDYEHLLAQDTDQLFLNNDSTFDRLRGFSLGRSRRY